MGGLVIKKAFILARQIAEYDALARRVRTIFFLATPHRGSDLAQTLTKILQISSGSRPFVSDLHRNSLATQSINDEFPQHCQDLQLYSFYETLAMNFGVSKSLVVDKDMATLGYYNERTALLNANHREVCKFATPKDSNYITVRNALAGTVDSFRARTISSRVELGQEQHKLLNRFLGISDAPEDDFLVVDTSRMRGSCEWLVEKKLFIRWRDAADTQLYWISAKPATGKSVLAGYVIKHLREMDLDCCFYFFTYGDKVKTTIGSFLRSMAWQMASKYPEILRTVLEIREKDSELCQTTDYKVIWRKLFLEGILRVKLERLQYWVVDALDECKSEPELIPLLLKVQEKCSIRILVTCRTRFELHRQIPHPNVTVVSDDISTQDTKGDIELYLQTHMDDLPLDNEDDRRDMVNQILDKSTGCFLWVSLVLQELRQVNTSQEIRQVLEDVPSDMDDLYSRILESMSKAPRGKTLTKAILTWTVCSARPLTTDEMYHAIQIDMNDRIDSIEKSISTNCDQLVYVDAQSRVQLVHQTVRDFLLRSDTGSEFAINKKLGHKRLAMTCLDYLGGDEMKAPRQRKLSISKGTTRCPFVNYACQSLYEHILQVSSTDDEFLISLARFLASYNVLSWIEHLAQISDLNCMIKTGKSYKNFLQRRSKHISPLGKEVALLDSWATDLIRLVTKFGKNLMSTPESIFNLIPPFCPPDTAPKKQFAASMRGMTVLGLSATTWDDCMSTVVLPQERLSALASSDKYFAVGTSSGKIVVYHETTCQECDKLRHGAPVMMLQFGETGHILVSVSSKMIRVWRTDSWEQLWEFSIPQQCMALAFADDDNLLLGALKNNHLVIWDLTAGEATDSSNWIEGLGEERGDSFRRPMYATFNMEFRLLAIAYRGKDILIWDFERDAYDFYHKEIGSVSSERPDPNVNVLCFAFSQLPGAALLAAAYGTGDLVLFDTIEGTVKESALANAQILVSSPDGRTLASGDRDGTIQLFDFETLKVLYRINSEDYGIKDLAFSGDSHHLLDIKGSQCRVWDPLTLVRQEADDENSDTVSVSTRPMEVTLDASKDVVLITAIASCNRADVFFCGKDDGSIWLYDTRTGHQVQKILSHAEGISVESLFFDNDSYTLASTDSASRIMTHKLTRQQSTWKAGEALFDYRAGTAVEQVLCNRGCTRILVCTSGVDTLFSPSQESSQLVQTIPWKDRDPFKWASHPSNPNYLMFLTGNTAHIYSWETLERLSNEEGILLGGSILPELSVKTITSCFNNTIIATAFAGFLGPHSKSKLLLWKASDFTPSSQTAVPIPKYQSLSDEVELLIGSYGQRLVFLHTNGWVCSADKDTFNLELYTRHFFIPTDWLMTNDELRVNVSKSGDIIFVKRDEAAVIKRGLDNNERSSFSAASSSKRPLLLASKRSSLSSPRPSSYSGGPKSSEGSTGRRVSAS